MVVESSIDSWLLFQYESVSSTMDEAQRFLHSSEPIRGRGVIFMTEEQTAGRGRYHRSWVSPKGNLYASLLFPLSRPLVSLAAQLSFVGSLALADAFTRFLPLEIRPQLKWPNDLLLKNKKIAGLLLESHTFPHRGHTYISMGIGVNLISAPPQTRYPASSLWEEVQVQMTPQELLATFLPCFNHHFDLWQRGGFSSIRRDWLLYAYLLNKPVSLKLSADGKETAEGLFKTLDEDGKLLLESEDGKVHAYWVGDLFPDLEK